jgi:hypothetical protein
MLRELESRDVLNVSNISSKHGSSCGSRFITTRQHISTIKVISVVVTVCEFNRLEQRFKETISRDMYCTVCFVLLST